jgi:hypothetical protein
MTKQRFRLSLMLSLVLALMNVGGAESATEPEAMVAGGTGRAEIVIAPKRPRMVTLAALELQRTIDAISGARLPIVTERDPAVPVAIYVGRSDGTDALGINAEGLKYGGYRIASGSGWLVLLGADYDYQPPDPSALKRSQMDEALAEWDKRTATATEHNWGFPFGSTFKYHWRPRPDDAELMTERYGEENTALWPGGDFSTGFWLQDEGGSLNAVHAFLESLGARWYMAGDIGEVLPQTGTILVSQVDKTVMPDYQMRAWTWYNYSGFPFEHVLWARRLGLNSAYETLGDLGYAHGHVHVFKRDSMKEAHPEYYALFKGERDLDYNGHGRVCYASDGLFEETINYARFLFDEYASPHVSIWPGDGYRSCQCEICETKHPSEEVWQFVDRVGRELYKTHPDRIVSCGAYTSYKDPPESIDKFSPNVAVFISNAARPTFLDPERWQEYRELVTSWEKRLAPGRVLRVENNRYSLWGGVSRDPFPVPQARAMAMDLQAHKSTVIGEHSEQNQSQTQLVNEGVNHLPLFVQAKFFWDADQSYEDLVGEYYERFYGPAHEAVEDAMENFAVEAYTRAVRTANRSQKPADPGNVDIKDRLELVRRLIAAREIAGNTIYGERVQLLLDDLTPPKELETAMREQLESNSADKRKDAPKITAVDAGGELKAKEYRMGYHTGRVAEFKPHSDFKLFWDEDALIVDIRCHEPEMDAVSVVPDVRASDAIVLMIETQALSYYRIEVTPEGTVYDVDFGGGVGDRWQSLAEVETNRGDSFWRLRIRLPVVDGAEGTADPNNRMVGARPTEDDPWFINVGRRRIHEGAGYNIQFAPSKNDKSFGGPAHFAKLVVVDKQTTE